MSSFDDRCALVTGAARGIGLAIAKKLARGGASVAICDVNASEVESAASSLADFGCQVLSGQVDVSNSAQFEGFVDLVVDKWGKLDILVNNAGITRDGLIIRIKEDEWEEVLKVNLTGTFNGCRAAARVMARQRSGRIINIASVVGLIGNAGQANYAASKAGVIGLTKSIARELAPRGITVNAVAPGYIETEMTASLPEKIRQSFLERIPMGRPGKPEDVANVVAFLASDEAAYITGQVIIVDGGMVM